MAPQEKRVSNYSWSILDEPIPQQWSWEILDQQTIKSFLYFIQEEGEDGRIKIGVSRKPRKRLQELQVGNSKELKILGIRRGLRRDEQKIHHLFSAQKIRGEWFESSLPLLVFIEEIKQ